MLILNNKLITSTPKSAGGIGYSNTQSGLEANTVQDAVDELAGAVSGLDSTMVRVEEDISSLETTTSELDNETSQLTAAMSESVMPAIAEFNSLSNDLALLEESTSFIEAGAPDVSVADLVDVKNRVSALEPTVATHTTQIDTLTNNLEQQKIGIDYWELSGKLSDHIRSLFPTNSNSPIYKQVLVKATDLPSQNWYVITISRVIGSSLVYLSARENGSNEEANGVLYPEGDIRWNKIVISDDTTKPIMREKIAQFTTGNDNNYYFEAQTLLGLGDGEFIFEIIDGNNPYTSRISGRMYIYNASERITNIDTFEIKTYDATTNPNITIHCNGWGSIINVYKVLIH